MTITKHCVAINLQKNIPSLICQFLFWLHKQANTVRSHLCLSVCPSVSLFGYQVLSVYLAVLCWPPLETHVDVYLCYS